jgi:hypothetical protein
MANELKVTLGMTYENGKLKDTIASETINVTQTTQGFEGKVVIVGNSAEEDLALGDIATNGFIYLKNLDTTNYVTYGPKSGGVMVGFGKLKAGEATILRMNTGVTLRWQANAANVKVLVKAYEE